MSARETDQEDVLLQAVATWGRQAQTDICIEECSELIKALLKYRRLDDTERSGPKGRAAVEDIREEIADVGIMLDQMRLIYGSDAEKRAQKLKRLRGCILAWGRMSASAEKGRRPVRMTGALRCGKILQGCLQVSVSHGTIRG